MCATSHPTHPPLIEAGGPRPVLQVTDAMSLIVGTVIGAGIFRTPSLVASNVGGEGAILLAWGLGGALSMVGALCYAELATAYPDPGGDYHFLRRAFGDRLAFLFAWARLAVIQTGSIALLAFIVGDYAARLSIGSASSAVYAALAVGLLTALNMAGIRPGSATQNVLTCGVVLGLILLAGAGLAMAGPGGSPGGASPAPMNGSSAFGLSMVFVLLTYGGWNEAAYVSAEVQSPGRNMVRALVWSILIVTGLYLLVNWAYLRGLGHAGVASSTAVAADLVERATGGPGAQLVSALIVLAALTSVNATIFTGARTAYALGRDFPPLAFLGRWHPATRTPVNALLIQGGIALVLAALGGWTRKGFETMVEYTAPVFWLFLLLTGISLFVLRRTAPAAPPFRVPLYPLTPLLFCATSGYLLYASLVYTGIGALIGVCVLVLGGLVLAVLPVRRNSDSGAATPREG
jgi:basic amino acid/polyamine antiporter, APA family